MKKGNMDLFIQELTKNVNLSDLELEHNLQVITINKIKELHPNWIVFSVPNGGKRNKFEMLKLKAEGLTKGVSDLIVIAEFPKIYFIEMKASGGKVSEAQEKFSRDLARLGWNYYLIKKEKNE